MARLAAALLVLALASIGASAQLVIEDAKRQVGAAISAARARRTNAGGALRPGAPRPSDRPPTPLQIDISGFVVHEQLQLSLRNDGPAAVPSLLLCDPHLARAAYLEVRDPMPGRAAGTGCA